MNALTTISGKFWWGKILVNGLIQTAIVIKLANLLVAQHKVVDGLHVWWVKLYGVGENIGK